MLLVIRKGIVLDYENNIHNTAYRNPSKLLLLNTLEELIKYQIHDSLALTMFL